MLNPVKRDVVNVAFFYAVRRTYDPAQEVAFVVVSGGAWWVSTTGKEGRLEAQGEKLLQRLVDEEQQQLAKVEEAKREAARIVEEAQRKAAEIREQAALRADRAAHERRLEAEQGSEAERQEVLERAGREVAEAKAGALGGRDGAVKRVLEQVLP